LAQPNEYFHRLPLAVTTKDTRPLKRQGNCHHSATNKTSSTFKLFLQGRNANNTCKKSLKDSLLSFARAPHNKQK
jgi:hypothetical protein